MLLMTEALITNLALQLCLVKRMLERWIPCDLSDDNDYV
jgi:hypothetical protein